MKCVNKLDSDRSKCSVGELYLMKLMVDWAKGTVWLNGMSEAEQNNDALYAAKDICCDLLRVLTVVDARMSQNQPGLPSKRGAC